MKNILFSLYFLPFFLFFLFNIPSTRIKILFQATFDSITFHSFIHSIHLLPGNFNHKILAWANTSMLNYYYYYYQVKFDFECPDTFAVIMFFFSHFRCPCEFGFHFTLFLSLILFSNNNFKWIFFKLHLQHYLPGWFLTIG